METLNQKEFQKQAEEFVALGAKNGFDVLAAFRDSSGSISAVEDYGNGLKDPTPVCYRFVEVAMCRTKLIDIALLLKDCFTEVVAINQK